MHPAAWLSTNLLFCTLYAGLESVEDIFTSNNSPISSSSSIDSIPYAILDIGSGDVNGNMHDALRESSFGGVNSTKSYVYLGLDVQGGPNVDIALESPDSPWPIENESMDMVISSSALEHDDFFWETFVKMSQVLKPGGLIFLNLPVSSGLHRYPVDNYRFFADSAHALRKWALRSGQRIHVIFSEMDDQDVNMIFWKSKLKNEATGDILTQDEDIHVHRWQKVFRNFEISLLIQSAMEREVATVLRGSLQYPFTTLSSERYTSLMSTYAEEKRTSDSSRYHGEESLPDSVHRHLNSMNMAEIVSATRSTKDTFSALFDTDLHVTSFAFVARVSICFISFPICRLRGESYPPPNELVSHISMNISLHGFSDVCGQCWEPPSYLTLLLTPEDVAHPSNIVGYLSGLAHEGWAQSMVDALHLPLIKNN